MRPLNEKLDNCDVVSVDLGPQMKYPTSRLVEAVGETYESTVGQSADRVMLDGDNSDILDSSNFIRNFLTN